MLMGAWRRRELTVERRKAERTVEEVDMVGRGVVGGCKQLACILELAVAR